MIAKTNSANDFQKDWQVIPNRNCMEWICQLQHSRQCRKGVDGITSFSIQLHFIPFDLSPPNLSSSDLFYFYMMRCEFDLNQYGEYRQRHSLWQEQNNVERNRQRRRSRGVGWRKRYRNGNLYNLMVSRTICLKFCSWDAFESKLRSSIRRKFVCCFVFKRRLWLNQKVHRG